MWDGPITEAPAVADLVRNRLATLDPAERHVVDVVALAEPIGISLLDGLCDSGGGSDVRGEGHPRHDTLGTPARGPSRTSALRRRRAGGDERRSRSTELAGALAETLLATGARRVGDRFACVRPAADRAAPADLDLLLAASVRGTGTRRSRPRRATRSLRRSRATAARRRPSTSWRRCTGRASTSRSWRSCPRASSTRRRRTTARAARCSWRSRSSGAAATSPARNTGSRRGSSGAAVSGRRSFAASSRRC